MISGHLVYHMYSSENPQLMSEGNKGVGKSKVYLSKKEFISISDELSNIDPKDFKSRREAEKYLKNKANELPQLSELGPIEWFIIRTIIQWIIKFIINYYYNKNQPEYPTGWRPDAE